MPAVLLAVLILFGAACGGGTDAPAPAAAAVDTSAAAAPRAAYDFTRIAARFELPDDLEEISGLTLLSDGHLAAVQDEEGIVYRIDPATGEVASEHDFGGDGDYEGLALAGDRLFILRSDGRLYTVTEDDGDNWDTEDTELDLPRGCDAEGLAYDPGPHRLLVACKEEPGGARRGQRAVFAYDLATEALAAVPAFTIDLDALADAPALDGAPLEDPRDVKPSGLARHPATGDWYVLSAVAHAVVVVAPDGRVAGTYRLQQDLLPQPESIAFLPDGTMFIASEASGEEAVLLRFDPVE